MKQLHVVLLSALGMLVTSTSVYFATPTRTNPSALGDHVAEAATTPEAVATDPQTEGASFTVGTTLKMDGRLGHTRIAKNGQKSTFLMLEVRAEQSGEAAAQAHHLAIVIDRSGSMKGDRLPNAIAAGIAAVDHLGDGDDVSVLAFDTTTTTIVPKTTVDATNRNRIKDQIRTITLGGDTCISCGINEGLSELEKSGDVADRMILLSDGEPTAGVRDATTFESVARQARDKGVAITTIGVGTSYNQKIMGTIALHSDGGHYFVEDSSSLERIFTAEAEKLRATVALGAVATIELGRGVTVKRLFDRGFKKKSDGSIVVPLGNFSVGDTKTVLAEVTLPDDADGTFVVANPSLSFEDREKGGQGACKGQLTALMVDNADAASELDPVVSTRIARSKTAAALLEANELVAAGHFEEAQAKLAETESEVRDVTEKAAKSAPDAKSEALKKDLDGQSSVLSGARNQLSGKGGSGNAPRVVRSNAQYANPYML